MRSYPPSIFALLLVAFVALSGCQGKVGSIGAEASLDWPMGGGNGSHSETADCDDEGRLTGSGTVHDGVVFVKVTDSDGSAVYERDFDGSIGFSNQILKGDSGSWKIEATRSGNDLAGDEFHGEYAFHLNC